jgi:membrane protein involved in colicin uptake
LGWLLVVTMLTMPPKPKSRAARAAAELLQDRIKHIEALEVAADAEADALAAVETAKENARAAAGHSKAAYKAALEAGWTAAELRQLGYGDGRGSRGGRSGSMAKSVAPRAAGAELNGVEGSSGDAAEARAHVGS